MNKPKRKLPSYVIFRTWREIYGWLSDKSDGSEWALRALRYMEVAERKWPTEGYLKEGTLTEFSGIRFSESDPYSYSEAKRLIRLMMVELKQHPDLKGFIHNKVEGRGAITGKKSSGVWDYLRIKGLDKSIAHTKQPHLTLSIGQELSQAFLLIPNDVEPRFRRTLIELGKDGFFNAIADVNKNMRRVTKGAPGSYPYINLAQRRYPHRNTKAIVDGSMNFDLRTAFEGGKNQKVKLQEQWLSAVYSLISNKNSNLTLSVGCAFPYQSCSKVHTKKILDSIALSWIASKPLLDIMLQK
ncbi:hypothetical protein N9284_02995 [Halieaceae bacterium]|nr:hypothetical protein [Halieaceae bacterium]